MYSPRPQEFFINEDQPIETPQWIVNSFKFSVLSFQLSADLTENRKLKTQN